MFSHAVPETAQGSPPRSPALVFSGRGVCLTWAAVVAGAVALLALLPWPWALLCVLAPCCEETVFRLGLHEAMLRRNVAPVWVHGTVTLAFVVAHGICRSWALAPWVALPALFLGWMYGRLRPQGCARALGGCVAWHAGFNLAWLSLKALWQ